MKINLFSFLLLLFTCFCTATNAQLTWKQDRASKEYTILKNNEVLIENVERFHGISFNVEGNDDGFEVMISMTPEMEAEAARKKKEKCVDTKLKAKLKDIHSTNLCATDNCWMFYNQTRQKEMNEPYYFIKKKAFLGLLYTKNGYLIPAEYANINVVKIDNRVLAIAQHDGETTVFDLEKMNTVKSLKGLYDIHLGTNMELYFVGKEGQILSNNYQSLSKKVIYPVKRRSTIDLLMGFTSETKKGQKFNSLNNRTFKSSGTIKGAKYDCTTSQYVLDLLIGDLYGLIDYQGKVIVEPISQVPVQTTSIGKYKLKVDNKIIYQ